MDPDDPFSSLLFFGDGSEVRITHNRLPHWQSGRAACFLTFRLADSLPVEFLIQWRRERDEWRATHPEPWDAATEQEYHRRFSARIDRELDAGHGSCLLAQPENAAIVAEILMARHGTEYLIHTWVIMPNHVHVLMSPNENTPLDRVVGGWKRFSATRIHKAAGASGPLWQKDYFDRLIRDWAHFQNVSRYIRRNPAKAHLKAGRFLLYEQPWIQRMLG